MRKSLQAFGLFCLLFVFCQSVFAEQFEVDGIRYSTYSSGSYSISSADYTEILNIGYHAVAVTHKDSSNSYSGDVVIPSKINYGGIDYNVVCIAHDAFKGCTDLTSVFIPNSVKRIDDYAFYGCSRLVSVDIPNSVRYIESNIFDIGLKSVNISDSLIGIGHYTFDGCVSLSSISIPSSVLAIGGCAFRGCTGLTSITISEGVKMFCGNVFKGCSSLKNIVLPNSITSLGGADFSGCSGLMSVTLPDSLKKIDNKTFSGCSGLKTIKIPSTVTSIGDQAFAYCNGLTTIVIPSGVTSIGNLAFRGCVGLTAIRIPDSVTSIGNYAFEESGLKTISFAGFIESKPKTVWIEDDVRIGVSSLKKIKGIDLKVKYMSIGDGAFKNCNSLSSINLPSGVTNIGSYTFYGCSSLSSVNMPSGVTNIGSYAFSGCSSLSSVNIPSGVTNIGSYAFYGCNGLSSVNMPSGVTNIGSYAFSGCSSLSSVNIPSGVTNIGSCTFSGCSSLSSVNLSSGVTSIGNGAFYGCSGLTSVNLPSGVTSIGVRAFYNCSGLSSIKVPSSVKSIGESAFQYCKGLLSVSIGDSVSNIGGNAFYTYSKLMSVTNLSVNPQTIVGNVFYRYDTLHVRKGYKEVYRNADVWKKFKVIVDDADQKVLTIADASPLSIEEDETYDVLNYTRKFNNCSWQPLYVPFNIPVDSLVKQGLQVAELNNTYQYDFNGDGIADSTCVMFFTLTSGEIEANYPYLIQSGEAKDLNLRLEDVDVVTTEENCFECSSLKQRFTFVGSYAGVSGAEMYANNFYTMADAGLMRVTSPTVSLVPQRWYMKIENKNGKSVTSYAPSIRFVVDNLEENVSGITQMTNEVPQDGDVYSLDGVRQPSVNNKQGLYVRRGRKYIVR